MSTVTAFEVPGISSKEETLGYAGYTRFELELEVTTLRALSYLS